MEEIEVPIEKVQEDIHHIAHEHSGGGGGHGGLMTYGALLSALLAVAAAISALFSGHASNEAMLEQIRASDRWAYYQAKGIKASLAEMRSSDDPKAADKLQEYKKQQEEIRTEAEKLEQESAAHLHKHETLATAVTFFQVAIALTAIAVLARRRRFLWVACGLGAIGLFFFVTGLAR